MVVVVFGQSLIKTLQRSVLLHDPLIVPECAPHLNGKKVEL